MIVTGRSCQDLNGTLSIRNGLGRMGPPARPAQDCPECGQNAAKRFCYEALSSNSRTFTLCPVDRASLPSQVTIGAASISARATYAAS